MPADVRDVLNANIVLVGIGLLNNPTEVSTFSELVDSEVISTGAGLVVSLPQGMPGPGQRLELPRERIFLNLTPIRIDIGRNYPTERGDLGRFGTCYSLCRGIHRLARKVAYCLWIQP